MPNPSIKTDPSIIHTFFSQERRMYATDPIFAKKIHRIAKGKINALGPSFSFESLMPPFISHDHVCM